MTKERIVVGATVPSDVELVAVPSEWGPSLTRYRYVYSNSRVMLVDPGSRTVWRKWTKIELDSLGLMRTRTSEATIQGGSKRTPNLQWTATTLAWPLHARVVSYLSVQKCTHARPARPRRVEQSAAFE